MWVPCGSVPEGVEGTHTWPAAYEWERGGLYVCNPLICQHLCYKHLGPDLKMAPENPLRAKYQVSLCLKSYHRSGRVGANRPLPPKYLL